MLFTYVCGKDGRGTRSHRSSICWPYHTSKHMAHSVRRRTPGNTTDMTILVCIAVYTPRFICVWQMLPVWKHNGQAPLTLCLRVQCETGVKLICNVFILYCENSYTNKLELNWIIIQGDLYIWSLCLSLSSEEVCNYSSLALGKH